MKQVVQNLRSGVLELLDVPCPRVSAGHVLIQTRATVISAGTERMLVEFGRAGMVSKARQQPEKVRQVIDKIKTDGLLPTLEAVLFKLDEPLPLGYCNAGTVVEVGPGVRRFAVGDRVVSNGPHAEMVHRPENLCAKIPDNVSDDHAPLAILGAIGLQGIRLLRLELGESVAVFGLGLIGLLSVQMLVNSGYRVLAIDPDRRRLELARQFGATVVDLSTGVDPVASAATFTGGPRHRRGADYRLGERRQHCQPVGADVAAARAHCAGRHDRFGIESRGILRERIDVPGVVLLRPGPIRSGVRRAGDRLSVRVRALDGATQH